MLSPFDWIRRSETGAELIATLRHLAKSAISKAPHEAGPGEVFTAISGPCRRCWIYPRQAGNLYCQMCQAVLKSSVGLTMESFRSVIVWGCVNMLPELLFKAKSDGEERFTASYIHDDNRFLAMLPKRSLKDWLQDIGIYYGSELKGLLQVTPTSGVNAPLNMGEVLVHVVRQESSFALDQLRVRFYSSPYHVLKIEFMEKRGTLTFDINAFIELLEMAEVFRTVLYKNEQKQLIELLKADDTPETHFLWGRFWGELTPMGRDMLESWRIRSWPKPRVYLLIDLLDYANYIKFD